MDAPTLFDAPTLVEAPPALDPAPEPPPRPRAARGPTRAARPTLLAVDGDSLAHRAFHAYRETDAVYGFLALLAAVCDQVSAEGLVVGFDCREDSRRRALWPAYKGNRGEKDPALTALLHAIPGALAELGVHVAVAPGWEADDVVASAAAAAESAGWQCLVATSDRDAFALVSDATTVLRLRSGIDNAVRVTPERLRRDLGIASTQYVEYAAMRGDVSDNLPGVPGIGPARAAALLDAYASVEDAVADPLGCRSVLGRRVGQVLIDDLADPETSVFRRNVRLMTVERGLPFALQDCRRRSTAEHIAACLERWGLRGLGGRLATALAVRPSPGEAPPPPGDEDAPPLAAG